MSTLIQSAGNDTAATAGAASLAIGSGQGWATPTSGNLIVVAHNGDNFATTPPTGFTQANTASNSQAGYLWYKISAGTESTITVTPNATGPFCIAALEFSGITSSSPLDKTASLARVTAASNQATGTTTATVQANELIVCWAGPHRWSSGTPASPSWASIALTNVITRVTTGSTTNQRSALFVGWADVAATGTYASTCSWTTSTTDAGAAIATFKHAAAATASVKRRIVTSQAQRRSSRW